MSNYTQRPKTAFDPNMKHTRKSFGQRLVSYFIPQKGDAAAEGVRKIIFSVALIAFIITGGSLLYDIGNELVQNTVVAGDINQIKLDGTTNLSDEEIQEIQNKAPSILEEYIGLYAQNNDLVGWIEVPGSEYINYPVVQSDDNSYYLEHNFKKEFAKSGNVFADYRNVLTAEKVSDNIILYGHNIWSGAQFAHLTRYFDSKTDDMLSYYKEHPLINFDTIYEKGTYKIFACAMFNTNEERGEVFSYINKRSFSDKDDFNNFILDIMDRSVLWTDVDITYGDSIITLSTCDQRYGGEDDRCVVFARKVREGESSEVNVNAAQRNPNPLMFQEVIDKGLYYPWNGRAWDSSKLLSYEQ